MHDPLVSEPPWVIFIFSPWTQPIHLQKMREVRPLTRGAYIFCHDSVFQMYLTLTKEVNGRFCII